jgi:hypothetical protein
MSSTPMSSGCGCSRSWRISMRSCGTPHVKRQVAAVEPWKIGLAITSAAAALMGARAALFAAGAGYIKLIGG